MSCVKIFLWSIVAQKGTNIVIFYIFEYGAEYGVECSAKSGAYCFIFRSQDILVFVFTFCSCIKTT